MVKENKQVLDQFNALEWHRDNYTGENINIAILDSEGKPRSHMSDYYIDQFNDQKDTGHGSNVAYVAHLYAPKAKIIYLDKRHRERNFEWLKQNKENIDLINFSQAGRGGLPTPEYEVYESLEIPVICASGNDGYEDHISYPAKYDWSIAIGAYHQRDKGAYANNVPGYSNQGEHLDAVTPAEYYMLDDTGRTWLVDGTSYAAPAATGMLALYAQWRKENGLPKMTVDDARKFIHTNCKDLYEEGHDLRSGHGLFILPKLEDLEKDLSSSQTPNKSQPSKPDPITFTDISNHWARKAIDWASENGFVGGYADKTFKPNNNISRLEFALILSRLDEVKNAPVVKNDNKFTDFTDTHKYYSIIRDVCAKGYLSGKSDYEFALNDNLTREELAVILTRLKATSLKKVVNAPISFTDVSNVHWAKGAIDNVSARLVMGGISNSKFGIGKSVTRAMVATVIYRIFN